MVTHTKQFFLTLYHMFSLSYSYSPQQLFLKHHQPVLLLEYGRQNFTIVSKRSIYGGSLHIILYSRICVILVLPEDKLLSGEVDSGLYL
jgi:hypothetical protein